MPFSTVGQLLTRTGCFSLVVNNGSDRRAPKVCIRNSERRSEFGTLKVRIRKFRGTDSDNDSVMVQMCQYQSTKTVLCVVVAIATVSRIIGTLGVMNSDHEFGPCPNSVEISDFRLGQIPPSNLPE